MSSNSDLTFEWSLLTKKDCRKWNTQVKPRGKVRAHVYVCVCVAWLDVLRYLRGIVGIFTGGLREFPSLGPSFAEAKETRFYGGKLRAATDHKTSDKPV
ncbi:hypothetical protein ZHAS_00010282 [Anopheles sinensis]|uniref:Uncharacterized protein n=1 Tax=Anopheles sinensis TaxID=74873 RepID=A0A084VX74_ANOSI|nr:hypothetical protein ZHAS_00010282 [Anopheles sinensis]